MQLHKFLAVSGLALGLSAAASTAATVRVDVGGQSWDVTTLEGYFSDYQGTLERQTWWGQESLAEAFAAAIGPDLGLFLGYAQRGPYFAWANVPIQRGEDPRILPLVSSKSFNSIAFPTRVDSMIFVRSGLETYAVATAVPAVVPLPAGWLLLLSGLAAVVAVLKRPGRAAA